MESIPCKPEGVHNGQRFPIQIVDNADVSFRVELNDDLFSPNLFVEGGLGFDQFGKRIGFEDPAYLDAKHLVSGFNEICFFGGHKTGSIDRGDSIPWRATAQDFFNGNVCYLHHGRGLYK